MTTKTYKQWPSMPLETAARSAWPGETGAYYGRTRTRDLLRACAEAPVYIRPAYMAVALFAEGEGWVRLEDHMVRFGDLASPTTEVVVASITREGRALLTQQELENME